MNFILGLLLIFFLIAVFTKRPIDIRSNWQSYLDGYTFSGEDFYNRVKVNIQIRKLNYDFDYELLHQKGFASDTRKYLRISMDEFVFYICAAEYGTGFFVSWWLGIKEERLIERVPILNTFLGRNRKNKSLYQLDTEIMFRTAIHRAVTEAIDEVLSEKGKRLTELERNPRLIGSIA